MFKDRNSARSGFELWLSYGLVAHRFGSYVAALYFLLIRQIQWNKDKYSVHVVVSKLDVCAARRLKIACSDLLSR